MHKTILTGPHSRQRALALVSKAPLGFVVEIKEQTRSLDQNDFMWGLCTDVSVAMPGGHRYTPDEWKSRFMQACGWECQFLPGILDGKPFPVGFRSSKMTKAQMSAMIEFILAWGSEQGVKWTHERQEDAA